MNALLMVLVLLVVACGAEFKGEDPVSAAAGTSAAGQTSAGAGGSTAGAGGSSVGGSAGAAGSGGITVAGSTSAAGAGGDPPVTCDEPEIVLPTEFSLNSWSVESGDYCAACVGEPCAVCTISWGEPTWITPDTFSVTMNSFVCGDSLLQAGQCGSETECLGNMSMPETAHPRLEFTVESTQDGFRVLPALPGQRDVSVALVTEPGCSNSPENWDGQLLQEMGTKYTAFFNGLTFGCAEN